MLWRFFNGCGNAILCCCHGYVQVCVMLARDAVVQRQEFVMFILFYYVLCFVNLNNVNTDAQL